MFLTLCGAEQAEEGNQGTPASLWVGGVCISKHFLFQKYLTFSVMNFETVIYPKALYY